MKTPFLLSCCFLFLLTIAACDDKNTELEQNFSLTFGAKANQQAFQLGTIYTTNQNLRYKLTELGYYIDNIKLLKDDGSTQLIKDVAFMDFGAPTAFVDKIPAGNYTAIIFGLGLDPQHNATDPATVTTGPLSSEYSSYFWSWASLHIFGKLEGFAESIPNSNNFDKGFVYHLGLDELYRTISLQKDFTVTNSELQTVDVTLNVDKIFDGVQNLNVLTENNTQSFDNMPLAQKVLGNVEKAFE